MTVKLMKDQDLAGKRVLIRQDLNVPLEDGRITSAVRIDASIPTIQAALAAQKTAPAAAPPRRQRGATAPPPAGRNSNVSPVSLSTLARLNAIGKYSPVAQPLSRSL